MSAHAIRQPREPMVVSRTAHRASEVGQTYVTDERVDLYDGGSDDDATQWAS